MGLRFGRIFANMLRQRRPQLGDKWCMDEVFILSAASSTIFGVRSTRTDMSSTSGMSSKSMLVSLDPDKRKEVCIRAEIARWTGS